ncbi:hypothetical protein BDW42DRAFT_162204 [Aspergillus taichungensis]|uniref:Uncharacterized protein n=1 Tax=Aspergillus taichungensis TaxID=482145 RepID=A0A2J5I3U6_9EURO|nr:hypothetical protein BDW42DRAFT_162204 [Aspergillus taichungensis]
MWSAMRMCTRWTVYSASPRHLSTVLFVTCLAARGVSVSHRWNRGSRSPVSVSVCSSVLVLNAWASREGSIDGNRYRGQSMPLSDDNNHQRANQKKDIVCSDDDHSRAFHCLMTNRPTLVILRIGRDSPVEIGMA